MHIEPGFIAQAKVVGANATLLAVLGLYARKVIKDPTILIKAVIAAVFFSIFMQVYHVPVGPSELHFVGAMAIYLTLGFVPTLIGFTVGLLLQGAIFDPHDLPHLAVNSLSLIVPLIATHYAMGKKLFDKKLTKRLSWKAIVKLDAMYYAGVVSMVGFWLVIGQGAATLSSWLTFTAAYLVLIAVEPIFTISIVRLMKKHEGSSLIKKFFVTKNLTVTE